jgi:hypothetical protein
MRLGAFSPLEWISLRTKENWGGRGPQYRGPIKLRIKNVRHRLWGWLGASPEAGALCGKTGSRLPAYTKL